MRTGLAVAVLSGALFAQQEGAPAESGRFELADAGLPNEVLLLSSVRLRMAERLEKLPNFTCLETVERSTRPKGGKAQLLDTVRLEVAMVDGQELFAWPGAPKFERRELREMVGGTISNGQFGMLASSVLLGNATVESRGEQKLDGTLVHRFDYRIPQNLSGYRLRSSGNEAVVGIHGSFFTDSATHDLVKLEVIADDIPPELEIAEAYTWMQYQEVRIGEVNYLLPHSSTLLLTDLNGRENRNRMEFNRCRQYQGESVVRFDDAPAPSSQPVALEEILIPEGLTLTIRLEEDIDTKTAAVGDPVRGTVERDVKKDGKLIVPKGSKVLGRITQLEHTHPGLELGLQMLRLEFDNQWAPLSLRPETQDPADPMRRATSYQYTRSASQTDEPPSGNIAILSFKGARPRITKGLRTTWRTEVPKKEETQ